VKIENLKIRNFRGISSLDWNIFGHFVCLIGSGDSTKSTILEAMDLVLTPRRNVSFDDSDFYDASTEASILVEATVSGVPDHLLSDLRFGYLARGWDGHSEIRDEPQGDDELVLTIQLKVDETLEPTWQVVNERESEGKRISAFDRSKFGMSRIGDYFDWQFSWRQGSVLTRIMEDKEDLNSILADARRQAKKSLNTDELPLLKQSAENAGIVGKRLGATARTDAGYTPHLDVRSVNIGASILALHDGPVPLRQAGLGTRRLLMTGLQHEAGRAGGITLIDEIEYGLEPHRLRRLLHVLKSGIRLQESGEADSVEGGTVDLEDAHQIFLTTHSPVALSELEPADLRIVRSDNGVTEIKKPDDTLRPLFRTSADAFLARKIVICEGKTEIGFCRAIDSYMAEEEEPFVYRGTTLADGQGNTKGPGAAVSFASLGYDTVFFGDSDKPLSPDEAALREAGVETIVWADGMSIEERVSVDLPWEGFVDMVCLALEEHSEEHVQSKVAGQLQCPPTEVPVDPEEWGSLSFDEFELRTAFAKAAKSRKAGWFKRVDRAEKLGELVLRHWDDIEGLPLGAGITQLKRWIYD
jgi:hypothetical protein